MDLIVQLIKPDHFHRPAHEELYTVLLEMRENKPKADRSNRSTSCWYATS